MLAVREAGAMEVLTSDGAFHDDARETAIMEAYQARGPAERIADFRNLFDCAKTIFVALSKYNCDVKATCKVADGVFSIDGTVVLWARQYDNYGPKPGPWLDGALRELMRIANSTDLRTGWFLLELEQTVILKEPR